MRKIAVIVGYNEYDSYDRKVIESISDWAEVSEDEYNTLTQAAMYNTFTVVEQPRNQREFIEKTVADYLEEIAKREAEYEQRRLRADQLRQEKAAKKALRKEAKTNEDRRQLFEQLKKEFEAENPPLVEKTV